jgi:hypothetical protein
MKRSVFLVLILSIVLLGIAIQSAAKRAPVQTEAQSEAVPQIETQTNEQGAVTVAVTPLNLTSSDNTLDFEVKLDTHSVELDMDLAVLSTLTTNSGLEVKPIAWDGVPGGHHVSGKLSFPASVNGVRLTHETSSLVLTIRDVDAPERIFRWETK